MGSEMCIRDRSYAKYFAKNYHFEFIPRNELFVDIDGNLQTKIIYFIVNKNGRLATERDFEMLPRLEWIQDSFQKYLLPYSLLDGSDESVKPYKTLYYVDFDGYIDPSHESQIKDVVLNTFRKEYPG